MHVYAFCHVYEEPEQHAPLCWYRTLLYTFCLVHELWQREATLCLALYAFRCVHAYMSILAAHLSLSVSFAGAGWCWLALAGAGWCSLVLAWLVLTGPSGC